MDQQPIRSNLGFDVPEVDLTHANPARVYDYWLGGSANFDVDRAKGDHIIEGEPKVVDAARANRAFLGRTVRYCVDQGIRQFLDLGSGIPTVGNVHEIAQQRDPGCRVAYVDNEPVAVAHSTQLLKDNPRATMTSADLREPATVLGAPGVRELLDFDRPVALLAVMVLQYFPDDAVLAALIAEYRAALAPGSAVALSHLTADDPSIDMTSIAERTCGATHTAHPRTRAEVQRLLAGTEIVDPGIVYVHEWHPDSGAAHVTVRNGVYGAIGRIPAR